MAVTKLKKINVKSFRKLKNIEFEFSNRINIICGQNGTSKSTILGIAAQIFSFDYEYNDIENPKCKNPIDYKTIDDKPFKSQFNEHFRLSKKYDIEGTMDVSCEIFDGYFEKDITSNLSLTGHKDRNHRMVNRWKLECDTLSRNFTHPVIYLNLKRLTPIVNRKKYNSVEIEKIEFFNDKKNQTEFILLSNKILCKASKAINITPTEGDINSTVAHGKNYDHESISVGEDNVGQLIQALMSFLKLKSEYNNYKGGLLLIDEIDAGLFPAAQEKLMDVLNDYSKKLNLQIIMTTHSPTIIEYVHQNLLQDKPNHKIIYLSEPHGTLINRTDISWPEIYSNLFVKPSNSKRSVLPKIDIYFEDEEARLFFSRIITSKKIKDIINIMKKVNLGCTNYIELINKRVPTFEKLSVIVLDGDVNNEDKKKNKKKISDTKNIVLLPFNKAPDQLFFEYLFNLPANDSYWIESKQEKQIFLSNNSVDKIISRLKITDFESPIDISELIKNFEKQDKNTIRNLFKTFITDNDIKQYMKLKKYDPFYRMLTDKISEQFKKDFIDKITYVLNKGYGINKEYIDKYFE